MRAVGTIPVFVGLDYHQDSVQVAVMDEQGRLLGNRRCGNDGAKVRFFAESFGYVVRAAIEACCGPTSSAGRWTWAIPATWPG